MAAERKEKNNVRIAVYLRIILILLALFFLITVGGQFYIRFYNPLQTETAMIYKASNEIVFKGIHVRNERLVRYSGADVIAYIHPDGSKLGRNPVVAQSYKTTSDILLQRRIGELGERVALLEGAAALINTDNSQLESYNNQITNRHSQLLWNINAGDYSSVAQLKNEYLSLQSRKQVLRNDDGLDLKGRIGLIQGEIATLRANMSASPRNVSIEEAGYFVSVVDGHESTLNFDKANALSKRDIERIIREPSVEIAENVIGKIIDGYKWRFIGILDTRRTRSFYVDSVLDFRIGTNPQIVQATVISVRRLDDGTSIFVFECDTLTPEFASQRVSRFSLQLDTFRGIRIPTSAVHFNQENERGVYVQNGAELIFRRIRVMRTERDFFLVEDTTTVPGFISLYDNVVVRGRDLYEGKIVG